MDEKTVMEEAKNEEVVPKESAIEEVVMDELHHGDWCYVAKSKNSHYSRCS